MGGFEVIILAAGSPKNAGEPCSLWSFTNGRSILDYQINVFKQALPQSKIKIAIGYGYEDIVATYPDLHFFHVLNWEVGTPLDSLTSIPLDITAPIIVIYGDTVFHAETIENVAKAEGDVVIGIDTTWKERFHDRSPEDLALAEVINIQPYGSVEYCGIVKISSGVVAWILETQKTGALNKNFIELIYNIQSCGFSVTAHDVSGNWAELNEPNDLMHFILGNKSETLRRIQSQLKKSIICEQLTCSWHDWNYNRSNFLEILASKFGNQKLIVRSSSCSEDTWTTSNAGAFESVLGVSLNELAVFEAAVSKVFNSYNSLSGEDLALIQPCITDVAMSGVLFSCDLSTGAPYYIINFDDTSGRTDTVTHGSQGDVRTVVVLRANAKSISLIDPRLTNVIEAAQEIERVLGFDKLDIEFALDKKFNLYTFQIRPIAVKHNFPPFKEHELSTILLAAQKQYQRWQTPSPNALGDYTIFSRMTDWNPAEIIGHRPHPFAVSLYQYLITDEVWARQRAEYGYRDIRPAPLVHIFCHQPFVDCRAALNSFIPSSLPESLASRLADAYLHILQKNIHLHDKIEFDVAFTVWTPSFREEARQRLGKYNFSSREISLIESALKTLTAQALVRLDDDIASTYHLKDRREKLIQSTLSPFEKVFELIYDCKTYGTLAFAHAARAGFVSITLLRSFIKKGFLTERRMLEFQGSVATVATDFQSALEDDSLDQAYLIDTYGHLRPGTYEPIKLAYWEDPDFYFQRRKLPTAQKQIKKAFTFTKKELDGMETVLKNIPIDISLAEFIQFLSGAIQAREKTKFEFSKNISAAIDILNNHFTKDLGLQRQDVGFLTFDDICNLRVGRVDEKNIHYLLKTREIFFASCKSIMLPSCLSSIYDFVAYEQSRSQANFVTRASVIAEVVFIDSPNDIQINEKIVAISNADPGFDWLFSYKIAGLITRYGGANSHMAIRCAELNIPAAIGVGEQIYGHLKSRRVLLDCQNECIRYV
ncbi:PEP-utilizing enzyme [Alphaproteobacteria bacterium]|nr:PEP-utilizing enzyme [Alphaproteobacteria bacterium]